MEDPERRVEVFRTAVDPCRSKILKILKEEKPCVCVTPMMQPQSFNPHHLSRRKRGSKRSQRCRWPYYRLADEAVNEMVKQAEISDKINIKGEIYVLE